MADLDSQMEQIGDLLLKCRVEILEEAEEKAGAVMGDWFPDGKASAKGIRALVFAVNKSKDSSYTWEQAAGSSLGDLASLGGEAGPPTSAA